LIAVPANTPGALHRNPTPSGKRSSSDRDGRRCAQLRLIPKARQTAALLDSIDVATPVGLRDRALIGLMVYSFARIGAALAMKVEDVYVQNRRLWVRLHEKGGSIRRSAAARARLQWNQGWAGAWLCSRSHSAPASARYWGS
jgi:integrase